MPKIMIETAKRVKPCPYCGGEDISIALKTDCYSSWVRVQCEKCYAYKESGADKPNSDFPNPVRNWRQRGVIAWNKKVYKNETRVIER